MKLKRVKIKNYRQFIDTEINFEDDITILAGANNSGKTSLIELLNNVLCSQKSGLCKDDISIVKTKQWLDKIYEIIKGIYKAQDQSNITSKIMNRLFPKEEETSPKNQIEPFEPITVNIEVTYEEEEDIGKFADYLMDLDEHNKSFYFKFEYVFNEEQLRKSLEEKIQNSNSSINSILKFEDEQKDKQLRNEQNLKDKLFNWFTDTLTPKYYFTDRQFVNKIEMNSKDFKLLFNFHSITANRSLDDEAVDKKKLISKGMINYISNDVEWNKLIKTLPDNLIDVIDATEIRQTIQQKSLAGLTSAMQVISQTNGGHSGNIILDWDIDEEAIKRLMGNITNAKYMFNDDYLLKESAQGLGYSNLIYMHLNLEEYLTKIDNTIINVFVIEEPEAHMHPQMQKVFINYLFEYYNGKNIQGLITSHSSEIVKECPLKKLRVIRPFESPFKNAIFDMKYFLNNLDSEDTELQNFYNTLFSINFSNIIFADKIIIYEGDTERMYLQKVLQLDKFKVLNNQYIAFVQVGGAYAHKYYKLIEFLKIKTLILTDIDYEKSCIEPAEILDSESSNYAIKHFYTTEHDNPPPNIKTIYELHKAQAELAADSDNTLLLIKFQTEKDGYTRTLEEAMLAKFLNIEINKKMKIEEWKKLREDNHLKFVIPRDKEKLTIRACSKSPEFQ